MKKFVLSFMMMALPVLASAYDASVNGIYYNLDANSKTAEVTKGDCKQSGAVNIPETITIGATTYTVTAIGDEAFEKCNTMNMVALPSTITRIGKYAFYQCLKMESINLPSSITEIDYGAFYYCWELKSIDLPNSITQISGLAFAHCQKLETMNIPTSVTSIGAQAFLNCSYLTIVNMPNSVTSIGASAFGGCGRLTTIIIPESITSIGLDAFKDTPWFANQPDGLLYIGKVAYKYKGTMADNTSLELKDGTTQISGQAFYNCDGLVSIQIPQSVKAIGESAFADCSNLSTVNLPSSITEIEGGTFGWCTNLKSISLPDGLLRISQQAFTCTGLTEISFPSKLTTIESSAFASCDGLEAILIPASVSSIGESAFWNKTLKSIIVDAGNSVYDSRNNCNAVIETATNTLVFGCQGSFVPDGVEKIANRAFVGCEGLTSIIIPASVKSIGEFAFDTCPLLASVTLNEGLQLLGTQAFCRCSALDMITLPSTLTEIGQFAFSGTNLANINSLIEEPFVIDASVFQSLYSRCTLYVPDGTKANYQNVEAWKRFANIIEVTKQCEKPVIAYSDGKLTFTCETEGANFITSISDADVKSHVGSVVDLTVTYTVSVIATAMGYKNSETTTATLCWIDADPKTEGIENGIAQVRANAVLIQSHDGMLSIAGVADGTNIAVYSVSGQMVGSAKSHGTTSTVATSLRSGNVAIVRIGDKSVKVVMQ